MVKDPWPMYWSPFTHGIPKQLDKRWYCMYSRRYTLPCATSRRKCSGCLMKQMFLSDHSNIYDRRKGEPFIIHLCDRCGCEISKIDEIVYCEIANRLGGTLASMELCPACSAQLYDWVRGKDVILEEIPEEDFNEGFWD